MVSSVPWAPFFVHTSPVQRRMARRLRINWSVALPDAVLGIIFEHGVSVDVVADLSRVCHRWRAAARGPSAWAGKAVFIEGCRGICREELRDWIARWRSVERVHLTYSQLDLLDTPLALPHAIVHLWQTESFRTRSVSWRERDLDLEDGRDEVSTSPLGFWNEVTIGGTQWLACLTADRVPDEVRLMREDLDDEGVDLWASVSLGWTNARTFDDLAAMCTCAFRDGRSGRRETDCIVHAQIFPDIEWQLAERSWVRSGMPGRLRRPPLYHVWDQNGGRATLCTAQLDRALSRITMTTGAGREHTFTMLDSRSPILEDMRFFVALPDNPRLRRLLSEHPRRNFVELPVPFLASTLLPAKAV